MKMPWIKKNIKYQIKQKMKIHATKISQKKH